jgi:hypothetical protein
VSITEFLVHCIHRVLKEDAVMELCTYARLCFVILLLGMHLCVSNSYGKTERQASRYRAVSVQGYALCIKGTVLYEVIPSAS